MSDCLVITSEVLGRTPAGPGLRVIGIAEGLRTLGIASAIAAPDGSSAEQIPLLPLTTLSESLTTARTVVLPAALLHAHPEVRSAKRLCIDFAGPYPLEAAASGASRSTIRQAERSAVEAMLIADLILCSTERQVAYAQGLVARHSSQPGLSPDRFRLLPFGTPAGAAPLAPSVTAGPLRIVWPGGLWDWLDPFVAVTAVAGRADGTTIEFWGTQNPDPRAPRMRLAERLRAHVAALGADACVTFAGWIPADEFGQRLAGFDLAVTFDDGGREAQHAFRTRLLHALWAGVPTIATRGEHMADLAAARGAGWTIAPGDAGELAALLAQLATDRRLLRQAQAQARTLAREFAYPALVQPLAGWIRSEAAFCQPRRTSEPLRRRLRRMVRQRRG